MINTYKLIAFFGLISKISNSQPVISYSINNQTPPVAYQNEAYSFQIAEDTMLSSQNQQEVISYTAFNLPSWLSFNDQTFRGTPTSADFSGSTSSQEITLQGYDPNDKSYLNTTFTIPMMKEQTVEVNSTFNLNAFLLNNGKTTGGNGFIITPHQQFNLTFGQGVFTKSSSDDNSLIYGAVLSSGNSPIPIWLSFDPETLSFQGTAPAVNSDIAAAQQYPITLYATTQAGVSMASIQFSLVVGAHSLSIDNPYVSITTTENSTSFTHSIDLSQVKLDGSEIQSANLSSISLSSYPSWVTLSLAGPMNYIISGQVPPGSSPKTSFMINVFDIFGDEVNYNVDINYKASTTSSTSSSSSTASSTSSSGLSTSTLAPTSTTSTPTSTSATHSSTSATHSSTSAAPTTSSASTSATSSATGTPKHHKKNKHITAIVCGVVIPIVVLLILIILLLIFLARRRKDKEDESKKSAGGLAPANNRYKANDLEAGMPLALATASTSSSKSEAKNHYYSEKHADKSVNDLNAEALNGIPPAATAAELDKGLQNFLQDSSQTENDLVDSSNTTNSASLYSPIRHSQTSFGKQKIYYQSMKNKGKDSWKNVGDNAQTHGLYDKQPKLSPAVEERDTFDNNPTTSSKSTNRDSYQTLNSISTDEFMHLNVDPNTSIPVDENSYKKASLLKNRDSVFMPNPENTITSQTFDPRPAIAKKRSVLVAFNNVDSSVTKTDITDGQSVETASV